MNRMGWLAGRVLAVMLFAIPLLAQQPPAPTPPFPPLPRSPSMFHKPYRNG